MRRSTWLVWVLVLMPACADSADTPDTTPPTANPDGGAAVLDASAPQDAAPSDASPPPAIDGGMSPGRSEFDTSSGLDAAAARMGCFDGDDNDGDGLFDCADLSCQQNVPSCCVGQSSSACCTGGVAQALPIAGCAGPLAGCIDAAEVATFGTPVPTVRTTGTPALIPGGQGSDSGALFLRELDPRSGSLRINASIASPLAPPEASRIEMVGLGFVGTGVDPSTVSRVAPLAGVVVSRNRRQVMLVLAGEVVQRWPLETEASVSYTLELDPIGRVRLSSVPNIASADLPFAAGSPLRAIVYGRTANPADETAPTRVFDLEVTPSLCDMPAALVRTSDTVVPAPLEDPSWADLHVAISEADIVRYFDPPGTEVVQMALNIDGRIHLATPGLGGFVLQSIVGEPVLAEPTEDWARDGVSDPALRFDGSELHLYFTGWQAGRGTIGHAIWDTATSRFVLDGPVSGLQASSDVGFSGPAPFDIGGIPHIVLRVDDTDGHRLSVYRMEEPARLVVSAHAPRGLDAFAYDHDEVDAPTVLFMDDVYRLYFAGRRGTRWSIGLLVSDDGVTWREAPGGPVLSASGSGFDALAVRDPALDVEDGVVSLYHTGDDGERLRVGVARTR